MIENNTGETAAERERLLSELDPDERKIVEAILEDHPGLTAAKCIDMCRAGGL